MCHTCSASINSFGAAKARSRCTSATFENPRRGPAMPFAASLSTHAATDAALDEACRQALQTLNGQPDLALVFFSRHHVPNVESLAETLGERLGAKCLLGCMGASIVGGDREVEHRPALSLWLAHWARPVEMEPFCLELEQTPDGYS